jgi:uncharacterized protein YdaU (DUF1376 family)
LEGSLPADKNQIKLISGTDGREFASAWSEVCVLFEAVSTPNGDRLVHRKVDEVRERLFSYHAQKKTAGVKSGQARRERALNVRSRSVQTDTTTDLTTAVEPIPIPTTTTTTSTTKTREGVPNVRSTSVQVPQNGHFSNERWKQSEDFGVFKSEYEKLGGAFIEDDFAQAFQFCWKSLDPDQKSQRISSLGAHRPEYQGNPRFIPKPLKFLEVEWKRPIRPPARTEPEKQRKGWKDL